MKLSSRSQCLMIIASLILTGLIYATMAVSVRQGMPLVDASIFEYFGYGMSKGLVMYRDVIDHKGPVLFLIQYLGYILGGDRGIYFLYLLSMGLFFYLTLRIALLFTEMAKALLVLCVTFCLVIAFYEGGWGLEGYALPCLAYGLYVFLKFLLGQTLSRGEVVLAGATCALVFFIKANLIGLWAGMAVWVLLSLLGEKDFRLLGSLVRDFIVGLALISLPLCLYLYQQGILADMWYHSFEVNVLYSQAEGLGKRKTIEWALTQLNLLYLPLAMGLASLYRPSQGRRFYWTAYHLVTGVCLALSLLAKRPYLHYLLVMVPLMVPYLSAMMAQVLGRGRLGWVRGGLILGCLAICYYPTLQATQERINHRQDDLAVNERAVAQYVQAHTRPDERIYSHRMNGVIYLESDRLASTPYFFIPSFEDESHLIEDFKARFQAKLPAYIVFDQQWDYGRLTDQYIKALVADTYQAVHSVGTITVYQLK